MEVQGQCLVQGKRAGCQIGEERKVKASTGNHIQIFCVQEHRRRGRTPGPDGVRNCCARPPGTLTSSSRSQSTNAWAKGASTNCLDSYSSWASAALALLLLGFNCIIQVFNTGILEVGAYAATSVLQP